MMQAFAFITGPPTHSIGGQYCFALWRLSSSVVVCNTTASLKAASPAQARRSCRLQSNYSSTATLHGGPIVLRLVRATPGYMDCDVGVKGQEDVVRLLLELPVVASKEVSRLAAARLRRLQCSLTPVHWAADGGHDSCVRLLLDVDEWRRAADRPTTEHRSVGDFSAAAGTTPLMLAARAGSSTVVRQIVDMLRDQLIVDRQDADGL